MNQRFHIQNDRQPADVAFASVLGEFRHQRFSQNKFLENQLCLYELPLSAPVTWFYQLRQFRKY
ncbi:MULTISPECIES: hypothetical protein [unclassified Microcoleus]|uniref:hypothetical protein n=1 Tax=unclassified Microcoleus TaxID=2642155 RepID=UPI0025DEB56A|nr:MULTISPECIES: hypothetical protein [unclassified Microcoleus]